MVYNIKDGDLVIAPNHIKKYILKTLSKEKRLVNCKYMTIEQLKSHLFETYDEKALYYLMKNYKLKYTVAKEYLDNIYLNIKDIRKYRDELSKENLIIKKVIPNYQRVIFIGYESIEPYILKEINNYKIINNKLGDNKPTVYEFNNQTEELVYVGAKIIEDLNKVSTKNMNLVIPNNDYYQELNRIFKMYKIPINYKNDYKIYSSKTVNTFIIKLKETKDIKKSLEDITQNDTYNKIIDILNKYSFIKKIDNTFIEILINEFQKITLKENEKENAIKVINYDQIYDKNKYYYILGFNQNIITSLFSEEGIVSDKEKEKIGMFSANKKNKIEKEFITKIITSYPNIYISYKLNDNFQSYYPSSIISDLNLNIIKNPKPKYKYSNLYNKLLLSTLLDNYVNYNEIDDRLYELFPVYQNIDYKTYDNTFKCIKPKKIKDYLKSNLSLSYSSMNNYFLCPFKFYVENILKLNPFEESFAIKIGNLFHKILEKMYQKDFDIDTLFTQLKDNLELTTSENFFINKMYNIIKQDIKAIKMQDSLSEFKNKITEKKINIKLNKNLTINFTGIVDKISTLDNYILITDYKTGAADANLENIDDGLHLQLPVYIYLIKNEFKDSKIVGFYLQKLINTKQTDKEEDPKEKLKINGYTIDDEKIIQKIDKTYEDSQIIKGMKKNKTGFYSYTKLIKEEEIEKIYKITEENIHKVIDAVEQGKFKINPKRINNKLISCEYCKYKDLCYFKEDDITTLKTKKLKQIVGEADA